MHRRERPDHHARLAGRPPDDVDPLGARGLEALAGLLSARGIPARMADGGPEEPGRAVLLEPPGPERIDLVWRSAREAGVVIRSLSPVHRPLEEVFVETLRRAAADDETGVAPTGETAHAGV